MNIYVLWINWELEPHGYYSTFALALWHARCLELAHYDYCIETARVTDDDYWIDNVTITIEDD